MIETPRTREPWIDWLRAIASIAVVIFHFNEVRLVRSDWYAAVTAYGWLGVPVFFVVSGYCVMLSSRGTGPGTFLVRRYVRVLPPYWASLAVVLAAVVIRKLVSGHNDVTPLPSGATAWLATLTLTTAPVTTVPAINWVYWTLSYELAFYGLMALGLIRRAWLLPGMIAASTLSLVLLAWPLNRLPGLFFLDHWPLFACGAGMALMLTERSLGARLLFGVSLLAMIATESLPPILAGLFAIGSILLIAARPQLNARLDSPVPALLGRISYSLYLIHVPIGGYLLGHLVGAAAVTSVPAKLAMDLLVLAGCLVAAYLFNRAVELPAQRWSRKLLRPRSALPTVPEPALGTTGVGQ